MRFSILGALLMVARLSCGQSITVEVPPEIQAHDITLVPADSIRVATHISKIAGTDAEKIKRLLPYSVVLVNNGSGRLLATLVGFRWTDNSGTTRQCTFALNDFNSGYPSQVKPGEGRLFVLQRGLNLHFARRAAQPELADPDALTEASGLIESTATTVVNAKAISAFIDSVVIEGVGLIGPDTKMMRTHGWDRISTY